MTRVTKLVGIHYFDSNVIIRNLLGSLQKAQWKFCVRKINFDAISSLEINSFGVPDTIMTMS